MLSGRLVHFRRLAVATLLGEGENGHLATERACRRRNQRTRRIRTEEMRRRQEEHLEERLPCATRPTGCCWLQAVVASCPFRQQAANPRRIGCRSTFRAWSATPATDLCWLSRSSPAAPARFSHAATPRSCRMTRTRWRRTSTTSGCRDTRR